MNFVRNLYFSGIAPSVDASDFVACIVLISMKKDIKGHRWMPWLVEAMKDVLGCEKPRGAAKKL